MVVPEEYPDTILYTSPDGEEEVKCRFYPTRRTRFYKKQDGQEVEFKFDIAFPLNTKQILSGTMISAYDKSGELIVYEQELIEFHRGQLHCLGGM